MRTAFAEMISGYAKLGLLKVIHALKHTPLEKRYHYTDLLSFSAYHLFRSKRQSVKQNLSLIYKRAFTENDVAEVFRDYGRYWAEFADVNQFWDCSKRIIHGPDFPPQEPCFLGITFHIGNFELFGKALFESKHQTISVVAERLRPDMLAAYFVKIRSNHHINTIAHDNVRDILNVLNRGEPLGVLCDRVVSGKGTEIALFGKQTVLPLSIVKYAYNKKIPMYVAYCVRKHGTIELYWRKIPAEQHIDQVFGVIVATLEEAISKYPYQWHTLSAL